MKKKELNNEQLNGNIEEEKDVFIEDVSLEKEVSLEKNEDSQAEKNILGTMKVGKLLAKFAVPSIIAMLINSIYNIVDQIFIGNGVGVLGNAATTISFPISTFMLAISALIGVGGAAYAAIKLGQKMKHKAETALNNAFILLIISGVIITVLGLIFLDPLLYAFGASEETISYARDYTFILLLGTIVNMVGLGLTPFVRTDGKAALSMYAILIGAVLNAILDPIYIYVLHWGVMGAAFATITSQLISAVIFVAYFLKKGNLRFRKKCMKLDFKIIGRMCVLGISSALMQFVTCVVVAVMNSVLKEYGNAANSGVTGDIAISAVGIVMKINMMLLSACIGVGIGTQPILGYNRGAEKWDRVVETYKKSVFIATLISVGSFIVCETLSEYLIGLFGANDAVFLNFGAKALRIYSLGFFTVGFQIVSTNYFQGTGQPIKSAILSLVRQAVLLIPAIYILPLFFGLDGVLIAGPVSDIGCFVVTLVFVIIETKRLKKLKNQSKQVQFNENIEIKNQG